MCVCSRVSGVYPLIIFSVNTQPSADGFRLIHLGQDYTPGQWDPLADVKVLARQVKSNLMHRYLVTPSHIYRVMCGDGIQTLRTFEKVNLRIRSIRIANQNFKETAPPPPFRLSAAAAEAWASWKVHLLVGRAETTRWPNNAPPCLCTFLTVVNACIIESRSQEHARCV